MNPTNTSRNYSSISPSAKWVLLMKAHTNIPFARKTAELIERPEKLNPEEQKKDAGFWGRTLHFESRYQSIDQLLSDLPITNILELSAGYSFRGLDITQRKNVHYIDTDLPEMIITKKELLKEINTGENKKGVLEILELNALDEDEFMRTVQHFPAGAIVIVNEGLLMYLSTEEKEKLCRIVRKVLKERGGYWITADIYIKIGHLNVHMTMDEKTKAFFEEHRVEENRFESLKAAEDFFKRMGFVIDKEAEVDFTKLSAFPEVMKYATPEGIQKMKEIGKIHTTWRLKLAED